MTLTTSRQTVPFRYALDRYQVWRSDEGDFSPRTWAGEKSGLLSFVDTVERLGVHTPDQLTDEHVGAWWRAHHASLARSTRSTRLSQLRGFLSYCRKRGWISDADPTLLLSARKPTPSPRQRLDARELLAIADCAREPRDRALIALVNNLALRGAEVQLLQIKHLHLEDGEIEVRIEKTDEYDSMELTSDLDQELRAWLDVYHERCPKIGRDSYLVPNRWTSTTSDRVVYRHDSMLNQPYRHVQRCLLAAVNAGLVEPGEWAEADEAGHWALRSGEGVHTVRRSVARIFFDAAQAEADFNEALLATMALLHHSRPERTLQYIGVDRRVQARARILAGRPFLTRLAQQPTPLRSVV